MIYKRNELKKSAYFLSQYLWMLYIIIPILLTFIFPLKTNKLGIFSSDAKFNNSRDPIIFAHVSDSHINYLSNESIESFRRVVSIIKSYKPDFIVHTGDIVDNYDTTSYPRYGDQIEENWRIYQKEISQISDIPVVEVGGNHDMFGIRNVTSHRNFIIDYSRAFNRNNTFTYDDFLVHSFKVGRSNTNIIAINPFDFPSAHPPLLFFMTFSTHLLDILTDQIKQSQSKSIVISHYPVGTMHSKNSSNGLKFTDIIGSDRNVLAYLTGHTHPKKPDILHHGKGGIEIVGTASYQRSKFGMVTIDNDCVLWSTIDITNPPKGILSYPVPKEQITPNTIFNDIKNTEVRVVMFSERKDLQIHFDIVNITDSKAAVKKVSNGTLRYSRTLMGGFQTLYTYQINECVSSYGTYRITFSGDFDGSSEFTFGTMVVSGGETLPALPRARELLFVTFPVFLLILLIVSFVLPCNCGFSMFDGIEEWVEKSNGDSDHWYFVCLLGFLLMRTRFQRLPNLLKLYVFISVLLSFMGPILAFKSEDLSGFISVYGYYIDNRHFSADYGTFYAYFYLFLVCFPMIVLCSSFGVKSWSKAQIGDLLFVGIAVVANIIIILRFVYESVGPKLAIVSIGFVLVPIGFICLFVQWIFTTSIKNCCCKKKQKSDSINEMSYNLNSDIEFVVQ